MGSKRIAVGMDPEDYDIDITEFTEEDKEFIEAVDENHHPTTDTLATTTDLRRDTDLNRSQIHYRIDKFEQQGLLKVDYPNNPEKGEAKRFRLTKRGKDALDEGVFSNAADPSNTMAAIAQQMKTLRERLNAVEMNVETDSPHAFTERQRQAIYYHVEEELDMNEHNMIGFYREIFPTLAAELGYPRSFDLSFNDEYAENFPYDMLAGDTHEPVTPDPDEPTLAERVERLEDKVDELATSIDGTVTPDGVRADGGTADDD